MSIILAGILGRNDQPIPTEFRLEYRDRVIAVATLHTRQEDDVLIAYIKDVRIIDESRITNLGQELTELVTNPNNQKIVLNFENVSFMSSAMIGKLVLFGNKCKSAKVSLRMCNINENVDEVFQLMKLGKVFSLDADEKTALGNMSN